MFSIEYKGGNTVIISTKKATLVIDPALSVVGLKDVVIKDAIEVATEPRFAIKNEDAKLAIEGPGDYEVSDFSIKGMAAQRHIDSESDEKLSTVYRIEVGDGRIALLGNIDGKLTDDQLEELGVVDIVILPVGGSGYTLDATSAAGIVRQMDPKVIIPVHYADSGLKYEVPQDTLDTFTKELGAPVEPVAKYKVKSASAFPLALTVVELTRS
ncbi:Zn-dependent hydrolase [Candidatus Saccharibacteria bacterium 32-45-3]|nr:MAG: Zn-dependent hydrolase [Candidatus Saccharibacteria bacterium 32-45-3]